MAITLNDIKKMSPKAKLGVVLLIIFMVGYLDWFYFLSAAIEKKSSLEKELTEMQEKIKEKEKIANQLNDYITAVKALQENYKVALQKLPDQREIPTLFHTVALAGKEAGVDFLLFEPKASVPKVMDNQPAAQPKGKGAPPPPKPANPPDKKPAEASAAGGKKVPEPPPEPFYEEIPVAVSIVGTFQNILFFFDKVAKLPRIVNISDISIGERKEVKGKGQVITSTCMIKTYMFIDKKEKVIEKVSEKTK
jgi:type IV pilus assembly protein PilO